MRISTKGIYALEAIVDLAIHSNGKELTSLKSIAQRRQISEKYLERIIKALKAAGLVSSTRGAYGGYCLAKRPQEIAVKSVFNAVEGELAPVECLTKVTDCGIDCDNCPTRATWAQMWKEMLNVCESVFIQDILEQLS